MKKTILLLLALVTLTNCSLNSNYGLPNTEKINPKLVGIWMTPCIENKESDTLTIKPLNEYRYRLIFDTKEELTSYSKTIKKHSIMTIISSDGNSNTFYGFDIENDTLRFYEVNPKNLTTEINSSEDLLNFFEANINKHNFFVNACIMVKSKP